MGVLFDFFSAPSDEIAATAINRTGGPSQPSEDTPPLPPFDTLETKGIEPSVVLWQLEALLTGLDYAEIAAGPRAAKPMAIVDDGQLLVLTLTDELQIAVADANTEQLAAAAVPWSQIEEFGVANPDSLTSWLGEFAALARRARNKGEQLYCWVCV